MQMTTPVTVSIGGGEFIGARLTVITPVEYVRVRDAVRPDLTWSETDDAGHVHRFAPAGTDIPTAVGRSRPVPCDGSCGGVCGGEGYAVTVWHCRECDAVINPRWLPDELAREVGVPIVGPRDWIIDVPDGADGEALGLMSVNDAGIAVCSWPPGSADSFLDVIVRLPDNHGDLAGKFAISGSSISISSNLLGSGLPKLGCQLVSRSELLPVVASV